MEGGVWVDDVSDRWRETCLTNGRDDSYGD